MYAKFIVFISVFFYSQLSMAQFNDQIAKDPAIQAIVKLMNEKHNNTCILENRNEISVCIIISTNPPPAIQFDDCKFKIIFKCELETVLITGIRRLYTFNRSEAEEKYQHILTQEVQFLENH